MQISWLSAQRRKVTNSLISMVRQPHRYSQFMQNHAKSVACPSFSSAVCGEDAFKIPQNTLFNIKTFHK